MHVRRGRATDPASDRDATDALLETVAETNEPGLRVWYPPPHVAFGRRDARADGYERARAVSADRGVPPVERAVGGRAVAFTGDVLAFVRAEPVDVSAPAIDDRYDDATAILTEAVQACGVDVDHGEPPDSFCPGAHSLQTHDGKVAGLAQRVRRDVAVVAGVVVVADAERVASVLDPIYGALGVAFDPASVGSLAAATNGVAAEFVRDRIEAALVGDRGATVRTVRDT